MEAIILLIVVVAALAALGLAAVIWGQDSRPGLADDHRR